MTFTIPVAVLIGILLALGHLNSGNEIIAIRSSGITYTSIFKPAIVFGILIFIFQLFFFQWILPWGNKHFIIEKYKMLQKNPIAEITKKKTFSDNEKELRVMSTDNNNLFDVTMVDKKSNLLFFSHKGTLGNIDLSTGILPVHLYNVSIMPYVLGKIIPPFTFEFYKEFTLYIKTFSPQDIIPEGSELEGLYGLYKVIEKEKEKNIYYAIKAYQAYTKAKFDVQIAQKTKDAVNLSEKVDLADYYKNAYIRAEDNIMPKDDIYIFNRNIAFALNSVLMAILATPLAFFRKRRGKEVALGMSVLCLILFNGLIAIGNLAYKEAEVNPYLAAWFPSIGILLFIMILVPLRLRNA